MHFADCCVTSDLSYLSLQIDTLLLDRLIKLLVVQIEKGKNATSKTTKKTHRFQLQNEKISISSCGSPLPAGKGYPIKKSMGYCVNTS